MDSLSLDMNARGRDMYNVHDLPGPPGASRRGAAHAPRRAARRAARRHAAGPMPMHATGMPLNATILQ